MTEIPVVTVDYGFDDQNVMALLARSMETGQFVVACIWRSRAELEWRDLKPEDLLPLEIGHIERFRFIESPLIIEESTAMPHFVHSKSKRGRQLNSKKIRVSSRDYRDRPPGEKELERGVRSYMATHFPPIFNRTTGQMQAPVKRPGVGCVFTMSKKQFDRDIVYTQGE